jgi:hypothetical protein
VTTAHITVLASGSVILDDGLCVQQRTSLRDALAVCRRRGLTPSVQPVRPCAPQVVAITPELLLL